MNKLFETFVGELVRVTLKLYLLDSKDTENEAYTVQVPITRDGYLLEEDNFHYYFGHTPDKVKFSIRRTDVSIMEELELPDPLKDILDAMPEPKNNKDFN